MLQALPRAPEELRPAPGQVAPILTAAARSFNASARSAEKLRGMIDGPLAIALGNATFPPTLDCLEWLFGCEGMVE
jgi:hypothetical protein